MKKCKLFAIIFTAVFLCSCSKEPAVTETETSATTVSEDNSYVLLRPWSGRELLDSIFYCGEYRPLPIAAEENTEPQNPLFFDNGSATAKYDESGNVIGLRFERDSAPSDFSVYGIDFNSRPNDIPDKVGIADSVYGDIDVTMTYSFRGGGITELTFIFSERNLLSVYIEA